MVKIIGLLSLVFLSFIHSTASAKASVNSIGPDFTRAKAWKQSVIWKPVLKLVNEQKFKAAKTKNLELIKRFISKNDEKNWTMALIMDQNLGKALHSIETSVENFKKAKWPGSTSSKLLLSLYYAQSLQRYYQYYSWEINKREKVVSKNKLDLKKWTKEDIFVEIQTTLYSIWKMRAKLGDTKTSYFSEFVSQGSYPRKVRGTVRDAFTYFYAAFLEDTSFWSAKHSNETKLLKLESLLSKKSDVVSDKILIDFNLHPAKKIVFLLGDLQKWHWDNDRISGLLEARFSRVRFLKTKFNKDFQKEILIDHLDEFIENYTSNFWWSEGRYIMASLKYGMKHPSAKIEAIKIAKSCGGQYLDSHGAKNCESLIHQIERPSLTMQTQKFDNANKRSIKISYKNWETVHFRAYKFDPVEYLLKQNNYSLLPRKQDALKHIKDKKIHFEWNDKLENLGDYNSHDAYSKIPFKEKGFYLIFASADGLFNHDSKQVTMSFINITNIKMAIENTNNKTHIRLLNATSGRALAKAQVYAYQLDWQKGHQFKKLFKADKFGEVVITDSQLPQNKSFIYIPKYKGERLFSEVSSYIYKQYKPNSSKSSLIFTDRSVFRPGQKLFFKVMSFEGRAALGKMPKSAPNVKLSVELRDANYQLVKKIKLNTNKYGTASGEFEIPKGRALGNWSLITTGHAARQNFLVEEYKRPTMYTKLGEATKEVRLNQDAVFNGSAKYYYGMPVTSARVKYKITRQANYPYWYYWWYGYAGQSGREIVDSGVTKSDEFGKYQIKFTPIAPKNERTLEITYLYNISIEVLDAGGETTKTSKSFKIGHKSVSASISITTAIPFEKKKIEFSAYRSDLNGKALSGIATWELHSLTKPKKTLTPSEFPRYPKALPAKLLKFKTKGDLQLERWAGVYDTNRVLSGQLNDKLLVKGKIEHNNKGMAKHEFDSLKAGSYRLSYQTFDKFNNKVEAKTEFTVLGKKAKLKLPMVFKVNKTSAKVGDTVAFYIQNGYPDHKVHFELFHGKKRIIKKSYGHNDKLVVFKLKIKKKHIGGVFARLYTSKDHSFMSRSLYVSIADPTKNLNIELTRIRKKIYPGTKQEWTIKVTGKNIKGKKRNLKEKAEVLAYMYDKSLDVFRGHSYSGIQSFHPRTQSRYGMSGVGSFFNASGIYYNWNHYGGPSDLGMDRIIVFNSYGIGGMGRRGGGRYGRSNRGKLGLLSKSSGYAMEEKEMVKSSPRKKSSKKVRRVSKDKGSSDDESDISAQQSMPAQEAPKEQIRSNFSETAFWKPHLISDKSGDVKMSFTVPDSLTSWNFWLHAITKDLAMVSMSTEIESVKDLMVRTYFPRFMRQGDIVQLKVVVQNAGKTDLKGKFFFEIKDPDKNEASKIFNQEQKYILGDLFELAAGKSKTFTVKLDIPKDKLGSYSFKAFAKMDKFTDGEIKSIPILPSRMHLIQSKFITLKNKETRTIEFKDMLIVDPTLRNKMLNIKVDAQLFYSLLNAMPYLINYPYECSEQLFNKYFATSLLNHTFLGTPSIKKMAKKLSKRKTPLAPWKADDPNRSMSLIETPWVQASKGGESTDFLNMLNPSTVKNQKAYALKKLLSSQTSSGGFPWFAGGRPSPYITAYILFGFAKVNQLGVNIPKAPIQKAWRYIKEDYRRTISSCIAHNSCYEFITYINFIASSYKDLSYMDGAFTKEERNKMLNFSFKHWKKHAPGHKGMLALSLHRMERKADAKLVFDSVLDSAKTQRDLGTYWAPEDRSWLWYNDTIETHAFALRAMMELDPKNEMRHGLVQWLYLNKKLNHWKSTKATAEVLYSVLHYLKQEKTLGIKEEISIKIADKTTDFIFLADDYTGKDNFISIKGNDIKPKTMYKIEATQKNKGMSFVSATWHYSTEKLPANPKGDFFSVTREFFKREVAGGKMTLKPLKEGAIVKIGDQVEVHLSIKSKHSAEYIHLLDPRPSGFEPDQLKSGHKWDLGLYRFEEIRDSGMNFFFEKLPVGEYTLKHRIRANMAGVFKVAPATLQSVYAPEFNAFSSGAKIEIKKEN